MPLIPGRRGGLCLEGALVLPLVLLICWFLLSQVIAVTAQVKLGGALRRTGAELSLAGPAARLLEDELDSWLTFSAEEADVAEVMDALGFSGPLLQDLLLDGGAAALLGPLVLARISHWLDDAAAGQPGHAGPVRVPWRQSIGDMHVFFDWQPGRQQLWICLSWQQRHALGSSPAYLQQVVPLWTGRARAEEATAAGHEADAVWLLDNFSRGQIIRSRMGANLPLDFPVIAGFSGGTATSIKSIDLTAPTYAGQAAFQARVAGFIADLAGFAGSAYTRGETEHIIRAGDIGRRRLLLVVPQNSSQDWLAACLSQLALQAEAKGVSLEVVRYGSSHRYLSGPEPG